MSEPKNRTESFVIFMALIAFIRVIFNWIYDLVIRFIVEDETYAMFISIIITIITMTLSYFVASRLINYIISRLDKFGVKIDKNWRKYLIASILFLVAISFFFIGKHFSGDSCNLIEEAKAKIENEIKILNSKIDSLEKLPPIIIPIPENNKKGGFYITFLLNDSISGHYISPQGVTYILQGKRKIDSLYQGVILNINHITEESHFHFHINTDNQINGNFVVGKDTIQIKENVIVNDSEEPITREPEPPKPKDDKETEPKETKGDKYLKDIEKIKRGMDI